MFVREHLSFALGELGLSLEEFYDMSWGEYLVRCHAYYRMERDDWRKARLVAYYAMVGSHIPPKSLPKTLEQFMKLDEEVRSREKDEERERLKAEMLAERQKLGLE